jgi:hypothetical protein
MGGGCSARVKDLEDSESKERPQRQNFLKKMSSISKKKSFTSIYHLYQYRNTSYNNNNLLVFTTISNYKNDFVALDEGYKDHNCANTFKAEAQGVTIGYSKGYKLDVCNQDKFFVLLDGAVEIFCLIDGHGPYGNIVAQIVQDKFFKVKSYNIFTSIKNKGSYWNCILE